MKTIGDCQLPIADWTMVEMRINASRCLSRDEQIECTLNYGTGAVVTALSGQTSQSEIDRMVGLNAVATAPGR